MHNSGESAHDDIAFAAYSLWENEGRREGHEMEDWLRAESLLRQAGPQAAVQPLAH